MNDHDKNPDRKPEPLVDLDGSDLGDLFRQVFDWLGPPSAPRRTNDKDGQA